MQEIPTHIAVSLAGFAIGIAFGATVHRTNYCMMGAVADLTLKGDARRFRAWLLAIAVALLGTQVLAVLGIVDLQESRYLAPELSWAGAVLGGLAFGFGMVIACGCGSRNLVNLAAGDLRALIALVFLAIVAYATMNGLMAPLREMLEVSTSVDLTAFGIATQGLADVTGIVGPTASAGLGIAIALLLVWFCLRDSRFRASPRLVVAGGAIGGLVVLGWLTTTHFGADDFEPVATASLTFVGPVAQSLQYLMTFTGAQIDFGIATVGGVLVGAFVSARLAGEFALRAFEDVHDLTRYVAGGALMGAGGVFALGCTVGQGITGVSTLALGSWLALASIVAGAVLGVRYVEQGSIVAAMKAMLSRA